MYLLHGYGPESVCVNSLETYYGPHQPIPCPQSGPHFISAENVTQGL